MSLKLNSVIVMLSVVLTLASCSTSRRGTARPVGGAPSGKELSVPSTKNLSTHSRALVDEARSWLGTPYKYGGNDRRGVDCSGLVLQVYSKALDISVPRNSRAQKDFCAPASKNSLTPGDLVFFATGKDKKRVSHVGIFVGENRMIHASASRGVIVSDLSEGYYSRTFAGAGYVGEYHAMLEKGGKKKRQKPRKPSAPSVPSVPSVPESIPVTEPLPDPSATEIASLPAEPEIFIVPDDDSDGIIRPVPEADPEAEPEPAPETAPAPTPEPEPTPEILPEPEPAVTASAPAVTVKTPAPAATTTVTPVKPVQTTPKSAAATPEPGVGDARSSVLGSIIEKPLQ